MCIYQNMAPVFSLVLIFGQIAFEIPFGGGNNTFGICLNWFNIRKVNTDGDVSGKKSFYRCHFHCFCAARASSAFSSLSFMNCSASFSSRISVSLDAVVWATAPVMLLSLSISLSIEVIQISGRSIS